MLIIVSLIGNILPETIFDLISVTKNLRRRNKLLYTNRIDQISDMPEAVGDDLLLE